MKKIIYIILVFIFLLAMFTGCSGDEEDITSSEPSVENMENDSSDRDLSIEKAIRVCEEIRKSIEDIIGVNEASVYINHESVLVALRMDSGYEINTALRDEIGDMVKEMYPMERTISISDDPEVYRSISRLVKSFKENNEGKELLQDLKEIIKNLKEGN